MPAKGGWGRHGSTIVKLNAVSKSAVKDALKKAWLNTAPKRIVQKANPIS
jgi:hypothetical protein